MDRERPLTSTLLGTGRNLRDGRGWDRWGGWRGAGLLLVALIVPFGWLLPAAQIARARTAARRRAR